MPVPVEPAMSKWGIWQQIGNAVAADQVFAKRQRQLGRRIDELGGFDLLAQGDGLAIRVGDFDAHRRFSGDALDQNRFGFEREAQIVREARDAAVFDSRFRLELVGCHHRARIDLGHAAADVKLLAFLFDGVRAFLEFVLFDFFVARRWAQANRGREVGSWQRLWKFSGKKVAGRTAFSLPYFGK